MSIASLVANASPELIINAGATLGTQNMKFPFLPAGGRLLKAPGGQQEVEDLLRRGTSLTSTDVSVLADYLALGTVCHLFAGWRYLGKSAYAMMDAARHTSLHLAYYAELRAAMAILASAGIGMLNTCHFSISQKGKIEIVGHLPKNGSQPAVGNRQDRLGTHNAVWQCLKTWSELPSSNDSVLGQFNVLGFDGKTWVSAFGIPSATPLRWLADWSIDLKSLYGDSALRNEASYCIDLRDGSFDPILDNETRYFLAVGRACAGDDPGEPSGIDLILARDLCVKAYRGTGGRSDKRVWGILFRHLVRQGGIKKPDAKAKINAIRLATDASGGRIVTAAKKANKNLEGVFSRALLLLRLATLITRGQWRQMGRLAPNGNTNWQEPMLNQFAANCHFVGVGTAQGDYRDLIADHNAALEDLENWRTTNPSGVGGDIWNQKSAAAAIREICRLERVGLWALAS